MTAHAIDSPTTLTFTGERMVPHASDIFTELFHWQRYLFFRPWYEGRRIVDAASGEGYGTNYAANFASDAIGIEIAGDAIAHARAKYARSRSPLHILSETPTPVRELTGPPPPGTNIRQGEARFVQGDVCEYDYSDADLVISFETIEHLEDPTAFLEALKTCPGTIVISTPNRETYSLGNEAGDKPLNPFHTIEWSCSEFVDLIRTQFPDRSVEFLSQQATWPGTIREGVDENCAYIIAVIRSNENAAETATPRNSTENAAETATPRNSTENAAETATPRWPRLGISVPTHNGSLRCRDLVVGMTRYYPGDIHFAIVDNASRHEEALALDQLHADFPFHVDVLHLTGNVGYGIGANTGLDFLWQQEWFDFFCVSNDDVIPAVDCLAQLVSAMKELEKGGHKPGVIGPVTNSISGAQKVDIGNYQSYSQMIDFAELWHRDHHSIGTQVNQLRGLFMLIHPDCLSDLGGFDPVFGIGNFEDDDYNLRTRLAGYTIWIAEGAFLHHAGSSTFSEMKVDYEASITRNMQLICEKWGFASFNEFLTIQEKPENVNLYVPLRSSIDMSGYVITLGTGEHVDLIRQASDVEFAAYIHNRLKGRPREDRVAIIQVLEKAS